MHCRGATPRTPHELHENKQRITWCEFVTKIRSRIQESHGFKRGNDCHHIADQGEIESGVAVDFGLPPCTPDPRPRENSTLHEAEIEAMAAKPPRVQAPNLTVGTFPIHYVSVYKYLGSLVTYNASMAPEPAALAASI